MRLILDEHEQTNIDIILEGFWDSIGSTVGTITNDIKSTIKDKKQQDKEQRDILLRDGGIFVQGNLRYIKTNFPEMYNKYDQKLEPFLKQLYEQGMTEHSKDALQVLYSCFQYKVPLEHTNTIMQAYLEYYDFKQFLGNSVNKLLAIINISQFKDDLRVIIQTLENRGRIQDLIDKNGKLYKDIKVLYDVMKQSTSQKRGTGKQDVGVDSKQLQQLQQKLQSLLNRYPLQKYNNDKNGWAIGVVKELDTEDIEFLNNKNAMWLQKNLHINGIDKNIIQILQDRIKNVQTKGSLNKDTNSSKYETTINSDFDDFDDFET